MEILLLLEIEYTCDWRVGGGASGTEGILSSSDGKGTRVRELGGNYLEQQGGGEEHEQDGQSGRSEVSGGICG